ncbi:MAG: hypothetical protein WCG20_01530 [bacterium]
MKHLLIILLSFTTITGFSQHRHRPRVLCPGYVIQTPRIAIAPPCNYPCGPQVVHIPTWHYVTVNRPVIDFWGNYVRDYYGRIIYERVRIMVYD